MARQDREHEKTRTSLKEEIIQKIRQQEEMQRDTSAASTDTVDQSQRLRHKGRFSIFVPSARQMAVYARQLATLVDVGIPLLRSLQILAERSANPRLRRVSADLARRVEEGQPLSAAMTGHTNVFSPMFIGVVSAGESGGILDDALRRLADMLERRAELRRRVTGALIYPVFAIAVMIIAMFVMAFWVIPRLAVAYPTPDMLPVPTRILIAVATWIQVNWLAVLLIIVALVVVIAFLLRMKSFRAMWDRAILYLPIFGQLNRKINVARFSRTLGGLTTAGIPLLDALNITARTSDNAVVERTLMRVRSTVESGGKIDEPMRREKRVFDPIVVDMVMVGDEAGALDTMLLKIADTYDVEVDTSLRMLTSILEPLLIVILVVIAGFIAVAVFLPYVRLVRNPAFLQSPY